MKVNKKSCSLCGGVGENIGEPSCKSHDRSRQRRKAVMGTEWRTEGGGSNMVTSYNSHLKGERWAWR